MIIRNDLKCSGFSVDKIFVYLKCMITNNRLWEGHGGVGRIRIDIQTHMAAAMPLSCCLSANSIYNCKEEHEITRSMLNKKIEYTQRESIKCH